MPDRFFPVTLLGGRLHPRDIPHFGKWDSRRFERQTEAEIERRTFLPLSVLDSWGESETMQNALQLFGILLITMLGLLLPLLTVLFSFLPKGMGMLTEEYESERRQSEENIEAQVKKKDSSTGLDLQSLERTIQTLRQNKKKAEIKLSFLNPRKLITRIFVPLIISFAAVLVALQSVPILVSVSSTVISFLAFLYAVGALWTSFQVLSEAARAVNVSRERSETRIIELLSALVEGSGAESLFVKKIHIMFNKEWLNENGLFTFSANKKYEIPVSINNSDELMAKKVELGFMFSSDFLVEKTPNISSVFPSNGEQIVRFNAEFIQAYTNYQLGKMSITFLKTGEFRLHYFVKGENIKNKYTNFMIRVID